MPINSRTFKGTKIKFSTSRTFGDPNEPYSYRHLVTSCRSTTHMWTEHAVGLSDRLDNLRDYVHHDVTVHLPSLAVRHGASLLQGALLSGYDTEQRGYSNVS